MASAPQASNDNRHSQFLGRMKTLGCKRTTPTLEGSVLRARKARNADTPLGRLGRNHAQHGHVHHEENMGRPKNQMPRSLTLHAVSRISPCLVSCAVPILTIPVTNHNATKSRHECSPTLSQHLHPRRWRSVLRHVSHDRASPRARQLCRPMSTGYAQRARIRLHDIALFHLIHQKYLRTLATSFDLFLYVCMGEYLGRRVPSIVKRVTIQHHVFPNPIGKVTSIFF